MTAIRGPDELLDLKPLSNEEAETFLPDLRTSEAITV